MKKTQFYKLINQSNISDNDKLSIKSAARYFNTNEDKDLISNSYLFQGDPGIGKTFLADNLVKIIGKEVLYIGNPNIKSGKIKVYQYMANLIQKIDPKKEQVIYLDDLNYIFNKEGFGSVNSEDLRDFKRILDIVKKQHNKLLITTMNNLGDLDEQMIDRIEVKIMFDFPTYENKKDFLKAKFSKYLDDNKINVLAKNSIGYNFRDLPEVVKLAYRLNKKLPVAALKEAVRIYKPTQLYDYDITSSDISFKDVIGCTDALRAAKQISLIYRNETLMKNLNTQRSNLLLFHGPPGTGKTFMAKAIAGEVDYPLINIGASDIYNGKFYPFEKILGIIRLAKRYRHCVIFIDEAEKLIGNQSYGDDNMLLGDLQRRIEGVGKERIESIFILAINNLNRFGEAFRSRFTEIEFKLPEYEDRLRFCQKFLNKFKGNVKIEASLEEFARRTKGMSYRDLEVFWSKLILHHMETSEAITDDLIFGFSKKTTSESENNMFG